MRRNIRLLTKVIKMQQIKLASLIVKEARMAGFDYMDQKGTFIIVNPEASVLLASHLDTVNPDNYIPSAQVDYPIIRNEDSLPLGGDDRAGVFIMLQLIKEGVGDYAYAFFYNEEKGCLGSSHAVQMYDFSRYNCFIGLDRRGGSDLATYRLDNEELISIFELYGYSRVLGTITDVAVLSESFGIACVNLSVGFYYEHTGVEYINFLDTLKTLEILRNPGVRCLLSEQKFLVENQNYKDLWEVDHVY